MEKLGGLRRFAVRRGLDAIFISHSKNVAYFTGIVDTSLLLVVPKNVSPFILTSELGKADVRGCGLKTYSVGPKGDLKEKSVYSAAQKVLGKRKLKIGYESRMPHQQFLVMQKKIKGSFVDVSPMIEGMRAVKSDDEIEKIKKALDIAERGMKVARDFIKDGATEIEIAAAAEGAMRLSGAEWFSFNSIVASGPNPAKPHFSPTERRIRAGEFIVVDIGAMYKGYCSDITRTFCVRPTAKQKKIYNIVLKAQAAAEAKARPGVRASAVDAAARNVIKRAGYGKEFIHSTGHGVGLEIHESPSVSPSSKEKLKPGMVFTVEPGIYIEGYGGVRIEDMVLLTRKGKVILNRFPRELEVKV